MDKTQLAKKTRSAAYLTGQSTLRSGKTSDFYWDKHRIESDPKLLGAIVNELETLLPPSFDRLAGLELGGVPLATGLALKVSAPCLFVRKDRKTYGTRNLIEGGFQKGEVGPCGSAALCDPSTPLQHRPVHHRFVQIHPLHHRPRQIRTPQIRSAQIRPDQVCPLQIRTTQIRTTQICAL